MTVDGRQPSERAEPGAAGEHRTREAGEGFELCRNSSQEHYLRD